MKKLLILAISLVILASTASAVWNISGLYPEGPGDNGGDTGTKSIPEDTDGIRDETVSSHLEDGESDIRIDVRGKDKKLYPANINFEAISGNGKVLYPDFGLQITFGAQGDAQKTLYPTTLGLQITF